MIGVKLIISLVLIVRITEGSFLHGASPYTLVRSPTIAYAAPQPTAFIQKTLVPAYAQIATPVIKTYAPAFIKSYSLASPIVYAHPAPPLPPPTIIKAAPFITYAAAPPPPTIIKHAPIFTTYSAPTPIIKEIHPHPQIILNAAPPQPLPLSLPHHHIIGPSPILRASSSPHVFQTYDAGAHIFKHEHQLHHHQDWNAESPTIVDAIIKSNDYGSPYSFPPPPPSAISAHSPQW